MSEIQPPQITSKVYKKFKRDILPYSTKIHYPHWKVTDFTFKFPMIIYKDKKEAAVLEDIFQIFEGAKEETYCYGFFKMTKKVK